MLASGKTNGAALDLPPRLESELAAEAAQLRLPLAEYAVRLRSTARLVAES
jgi:hypothetical protein